MNIVKSIALLFVVILPHSASAAFTTYENTWFEVEVILFKQLGDKTQLQEVFPDSSDIPEPESIIDILSPYLVPQNKTELLATFPQCAHFPLVPDVIEETDGLHNKDDITTNESLLTDVLPESAKIASTIDSIDNQQLLDGNILQKIETDETDIQEQRYNVTRTFVDHNGPALLTTYETQAPLSPDSLISQEGLSETFTSPETYCELSAITVPDVVTGEEDLTTELPYVINQESLKLHDIMTQLKRSRSFKPLLHIGWRQITRLKSEAVPVKLVAGDNLVASYLTAFSEYNAAVERRALEQLVQDNSPGITNQSFSELTTPSELMLTEDKALNDVYALSQSTPAPAENSDDEMETKIALIIEEAKTQSHNMDAVLTELNGVTSDSQYISSPLSADNEKALIAPQHPPQAWSIDGLFKLEVERFLHITADFNVINMSIAEQATQQLASSEPTPLKSIRFQQNKRVRSNEIHYFDHPYMGMIVQVRRHEQAQPEVEEPEVTNKLDAELATKLESALPVKDTMAPDAIKPNDKQPNTNKKTDN
jgi:hypothetical protein